MGTDIKIQNEKEEFHLRVAGLIKQHDKYLVMRIDDNINYMLCGGHVEICEDSAMACMREIKEEFGYEVVINNCFLIYEHCFFKTHKNINSHWVEFYYLCTPKQIVETKNFDIEEIDKGEKKILHFEWVTKEQIKNIDLRPQLLKKIIIQDDLSILKHLWSKD